MPVDGPVVLNAAPWSLLHLDDHHNCSTLNGASCQQTKGGHAEIGHSRLVIGETASGLLKTETFVLQRRA